eukprot:NODE_2883_length_850_cov_53.710362_g2385_i0.p1 GENE.NODE_2883_length_850_cov_53.710362_g2385_i0~~NODE_2883_length_850_cov_53.710362_g2385_i0.p1  ORF type:complete len:244 (+),score=84.36 NODE_2883_length_850_cov_53.710362_g2385_i0:90-821(+)
MVLSFNQDTQGLIFQEANENLAFLYLDHFAEDYKERVECAYNAALRFRDSILFVDVDTNDPRVYRMRDYLGVETGTTALGLIKRTLTFQKKYKLEDISDCQAMNEFLDKYVADELRPFLKTQDTPEDWDARPVKVLTGHNFDEVTADDRRGVFVKFYAPWCEHCKHLAAIWDKLAEHYEDNDDVVIAKIDSTANELEMVTVTSFPTLKFFPKNSGIVVDYTGHRDLDSLKEFVDRRIAMSTGA